MNDMRYYQIAPETNPEVQFDSDGRTWFCLLMEATPIMPRDTDGTGWYGGWPSGEPRETLRISFTREQMQKMAEDFRRMSSV
ncbi:MAG: hypothetical protein Q8R40_03350 [bacterium]|nr:hypothetical protein [bacterium]